MREHRFAEEHLPERDSVEPALEAPVAPQAPTVDRQLTTVDPAQARLLGDRYRARPDAATVTSM